MAPQSYILLLWQPKHASSSSFFLNVSDLVDNIEAISSNDDEAKSTTSSPKTSTHFPYHLLVQVGVPKIHKNKFETFWDIPLKLCPRSYNFIQKNARHFTIDYDLNVVPIKNLVYLQRDYEAIQNVNKMPLSSYIMGEEHLITRKCQNVEKLWDYIRNDTLITTYFAQHLNVSQNTALQESMTKPFLAFKLRNISPISEI